MGPSADQEAGKDGLSAFWSLVCLYSVPGDNCRAPSVDQEGNIVPVFQYVTQFRASTGALSLQRGNVKVAMNI